jgi:hypothetical protein
VLALSDVAAPLTWLTISLFMGWLKRFLGNPPGCLCDGLEPSGNAVPRFGVEFDLESII